MSWLFGIEIIDILVSITAGAGIASVLSALRDYLNKKSLRNVKIGYKGLELKGLGKEDIEKILAEIASVKRNPQVFIMYSHEEKELAHKISNDLQRAGIRIWLDEEQLKLGDSLTEKIKSGLNESQWIVFIPPKSAGNKNSWVSKEMEMVQNSEKWRGRHFVIPIKTREGVLPDSLKDRLWVDFTENYDEAVNKLINGILRSKDIIDIENMPNEKTIRISTNGSVNSEN